MKSSQDLTKGSVSNNVKKLAIPASIGFFFNTMYNVVDTYFGGLLSTQALAALSISFPVFFIIIAFGSGLSTGTTALIANALGSKNKKLASRYTVQALTFTLLISLFLTIIGLAISPYLFGLLGATGDYLDLTLSYMNVIFLGTIFFIFTFVLNAPLQALGDTKSYRNFLIIGFFLNLILNPILMFGFLFIPALDLTGIALATVIIQLVGTVYLGYKLAKTGLINKDCFGKMLIPQKESFKEISKQGLPASFNMVTVGIGIFVITFFISIFGENAVAAYGIATRIEQIALLPIIGLNIATLAIIGQSMGAKKYKRARETLNVTLKYGLSIMFLGFIGLLIFAPSLMRIFTNNLEVIAIGTTYLRIASFLLWSYVILFMTVSALQGMKKPMFALWMGLARQIIMPLIIFSSLIYSFNTSILGIWWGVFAINWIAAIISFIYARRELNKISQKIN